MHVSAFMVPADKVHTCQPKDTIEKALNLVADYNISAIVVTGAYGEPAGIVTKTNLVSAYKNKIPLNRSVSEIMTKQPELHTLLDTDSRDAAAKMLEKCGHHHAVVVNAQGHFVGLISAWDIVAEVARDARAWPWSRTDDGKVHPPKHENAFPAGQVH